MLILDWIFLWVHGGGGGDCHCGDGSLPVVDGFVDRSLTAMGMLMGLSWWLMGFKFNGFWDRWLWVPMGFVQRWGLAWIVARSCMVVVMDRGEVMRGGSDGVRVWWL